MSEQDLLESINKKLDALLEEMFSKKTEKYNLKSFLAKVRISRYRLYKLYEEGFLTAFNPVGKHLFCFEDIAIVNDAFEKWINARRA